MGGPNQPSAGIMIMTLKSEAKGGDRARAAAVIAAVPATTGALVDVRRLGLHRLRSYEPIITTIKALVDDGTAYTATATPGGKDIGGNFTAVIANVVSAGLQWLKVEHNDAMAPHAVFILVEGRWNPVAPTP